MAEEFAYLSYLSSAEADLVIQRFNSAAFLPNRQVFWTGILREEAQQWADSHGFQTLTTAMGPLMVSRSGYVKGVSILFAQHVAKGESVLVLCPPPPFKFHPSGRTNYQLLEEPILKGRHGSKPVSHIYMCHPTVTESQDYCYEAWPTDDTDLWVERFGTLPYKRRAWRQVHFCKRVCPCAKHTQHKAVKTVSKVQRHK